MKFFLTENNIPQFGEKILGETYSPRPASYAVIKHPTLKDLIKFAAVDIAGNHHLPGGGIEGDESPEEALHREVEEETGLKITITHIIGQANQFTYSLRKKGYINILGHFFAATVIDQGEKFESDHELVWLDLDSLKKVITYEVQVWAAIESLKF